MKYRAEIDGLRAVAIIPVIIFHAGFDPFGGGFVGVDVFFVISGYLITTIILTEKEQGTFSLVNFYERRARRILPALFLVMFVSLPFAWMWLLPSDLKDFSQSLIAVSTFCSNILFWKESGYWGVANELKPLLHTWSLAVEEQYYIIFPLFLMLMWRFRKRWILGSFMVIAAISLILAQWGAYNDPTATFFLLSTRGWELAIGASIAFYFLYRKQEIRTLLSNKFIDNILSLLGLLMILYAVFKFDETIPFPSFYTLVPTVGTGLIILFSSPQTMVGRLLSTKWFVGIGLISYSAYLWHQPLFAFARINSMTEPSKLLYAVLAVLSILLAYLSWCYVEMPFRKKGKFSRKMIFTFSAIGTTLFVLIGLAGHYSEGFANRFKTVDRSILNDFTRHDLDAKCNENYDGKGRGREICTLGATTKNSQLEFAVFGDSHSAALLPAFDSVAHLINAKYVYLGLPGCLPLLDIDVAKGNFEVGVCENLASKQFEYVKNNGIDTVFLIARWSLYTDGTYRTGGIFHPKKIIKKKDYFLVNENHKALTKETSRIVFANALNNTVEAYQGIGVNVYVVEQVPQQEVDAKKIYYKLTDYGSSGDEIDDAVRSLSISRDRSNSLQSYNRGVFSQLAAKGNIKVVSLDNYYCDTDVCLIGNREHSYYRDEGHISTFGVSLVIDELKKYID